MNLMNNVNQLSPTELGGIVLIAMLAVQGGFKLAGIAITKWRENGQGSDHDLLLRIDERTQGLLRSLDDVRETVTVRLNDHSYRIKQIEIHGGGRGDQ